MKESQGKTIYLKDYTPDYLIDETHLTFQLFETHTMVHSRLVMRKNPAAERHSGVLVLNGAELELDELVIDGRALDQAAYSVDGEELSVPGVPDDFILECVTKIKPQENTSLEGLYKSRVMFCTQCEAEGFKITYYLDRPDVLSSFTTRIEADKALYPVLLSNGNNIGSGDLDDGRHWVAWKIP